VRYRKALAALDQYCKNEKGGAFASLGGAGKDAIIGALESRAAKLDSVEGQAFVELLLRNVREGLFTDPIYGGNRDMCPREPIGFERFPRPR
jgi:gluconate 2-dehydrogenase gamma chain